MKKKTGRWIAALLCLALLGSLSHGVTAEAAGGFQVEAGILVKYTGKKTAVSVPKGVTAIGQEAFSNCTKLKSVTLPKE